MKCLICFVVNVYDLDELDVASLEPAPQPTKPPSGNKKGKGKKSSSGSSFKAKTSSNDMFSSFGLQSVEDLMGPTMEDEISEAPEVSEVIRTEPEIESDIDPPSRPTTPLRSILSPSPRPLTPRSSRSRVRLSLTDVREIRSPSPEIIYTGRTRTGSIAYSEDFEDDESIHTIHTQEESDSDRTLSPRYNRKNSYDDYYSDDFTSVASGSSSPRRRVISRLSSRDSTYSTFSDTFSERSR